MSSNAARTPLVDSPPVLLSIRDRNSKASSIAVAGSRLVLGREGDVDVVLDSGKVSRRHAELVKDPFDRWWVRDLGSRNGTRVNGARVTESLLRPGDLLQIGDFALGLSQLTPPSSVGMVGATQSGWDAISVDEPVGSQIRSLRQCEPPAIQAAHLHAVTDFAQLVNGTQESTERLAALAALITGGAMKGRSAAVLRVHRRDPARAEVIWEKPNDGSGPSGGSSAAAQAGPTAGSLPVSRGVLRAIAHTPEPVLATNSGPSPADVHLSVSIDAMPMAVIALPLRCDEQTVELLYAWLEPEYGHSSWLALAALAVKHYQQAELLWGNVAQIRRYAAIERELEKAQEIQTRLVSRQTHMPGFDIAVGFRPCYWVGGDYTDVLKLRDGRVLLAMADVCGKGLSAALVASGVRTLVHAGVRSGKSLISIVTELNESLVEDLEGVSFVTMLCVAIDPLNGEFECTNCGHPPAWVVGENGLVRELPNVGNTPLGLDVAPIVMQQGRIAVGELLVLFTDGVTELNNPAGAMLDPEGFKRGLAAVCGNGCHAPVPTVADGLTTFLDAYQNGAIAVDDRTFLLARRER